MPTALFGWCLAGAASVLMRGSLLNVYMLCYVMLLGAYDQFAELSLSGTKKLIFMEGRVDKILSCILVAVLA